MKQSSATFETLFAKTMTKNLAIIAVGWAILATISIDAAILTVTNVSDSGPGSLRQAIDDANQTPGPDTIAFNIGAGGLETITPQSMLPAITDPVIIDGTTQPGFAGIPIIELNGANAGGLVDGVSIAADNCVVRGLVINRFSRRGIGLGSSGNLVAGNFIGTDATGSVALGNGDTGVLIFFAGTNTIGGTAASDRNIISGNLGPAGIDIVSGVGNLVQGNFIGTDLSGTAALGNALQGVQINSGLNNTIGGTTSGARNIISGNGGGVNITFSGATGNFVQGNFVGTDVSGMAVLGNGIGVSINDAPNNTIGGTLPGARNIISGNGQGITISGSNASSNLVQGNFIGTDVNGANTLGNTFAGVALSQAAQNNTIGGTVAGASNVISGTTGSAVTAFDSGTTGNSILSNSIYNNGGLGIELGGDGVTSNDSGDIDAGPNNLQNYPVLTSVTDGGGNTSIAGTLNSVANTTYRIEFFANDTIDPSGFGEGQSFVGFTDATTDASGNVSFNVSVPQIALGRRVTATATDPNGNTSEFSAATAPPVITSPLSATATVGELFVYQIIATQSPTSYDATNLPSGLEIDSALGIISGTPSAVGSQQVVLSASNANGTAMAILTITVQAAPVSGISIISGTTATGRTGTPFDFQVITTGSSSGERLSATGLPPGLSVDAVTGEISGTPTSDGSFLVSLTVTEAGLSTTATLELTFTSDLAVPVIVSPNSAFLFPGLPFSYTIEAPTSDSLDPVTYSEIGPLPPGLGLDSATGIISGTPQIGFGLQPTPSLAGGVVTNVQIFACNSSGCAAQGLFFLLPTGAANISTRLSVGTDVNVLIGGFITQGNAPMKLVARGIGPSLPLGGLLANPFLELHSGAVTIASNDNWKDNLAGGSQEVAIENTGLAPTNDFESSILSVLEPGGYTAILHGANNGTGVGLVEVYNLGAASMDVSSEAHLANISTRGFVQTGDNVMIGGFINQGSVPIQVLVRGTGPSLTPFGVNGALANPTLELHKPDGTVVTNDDWTTDPTQKAAIMATGLAPANALESAILVTLPVGEGAYTAIVRGVNSTGGVGLVEAYFGNPCLGTSCP